MSAAVGSAAIAASLAGPLQTTVGGVGAATLAHTLTAAVGLFVSYQAYRGFRRNESRPMLFLAVGVFFVTAASFLASMVAVTVVGTTDAVAALAWTVSEIVGLAAILYAFTRA